MNSDHNRENPLVMHIDLNSCFATVEQQARVGLRGRPLAITNRRTPNTAIITASYEAKAHGVKVGMRLKEAKKLCPDIITLESDPPKYRYVYHKLLDIMGRYSAHVRMKSIDEGVIDFHEAPPEIALRDMRDVGAEIKQVIRTEIGCAMRCNVGIGTNRFLAKTAAGLNKPDGMDAITHQNIFEVLDGLKLQDLTGIAQGNAQRLNSVGIYTPRAFYDASEEVLRKVVFKSVNGTHWYQRLRGYEVDNVDHDLKTVGRQYVCERPDLTTQEVLDRLHHLVESVGQKMRNNDRSARGLGVYMKGYEGEQWRRKYVASLPFFSNEALWSIAQKSCQEMPQHSIREIGVWCYLLHPSNVDQLSLFGDELAREQARVFAVDDINNRYGERTITSASTLNTDMYVKSKIPFGSTRYL